MGRERDRRVSIPASVQSPGREVGTSPSVPHNDAWEVRVMEPMTPEAEQVDHPSHYGGADNPYEAIKVIEAWELGFHLGNTVKYISRSGKKDPAKEREDLQKARWYLDRAIEFLDRQ